MTLPSGELVGANDEVQDRLPGRLLIDVGRVMKQVKARGKPIIEEDKKYKTTLYNLRDGNNCLTYSIKTPKDSSRQPTLFALNQRIAEQPERSVEWERQPLALGQKAITTVIAHEGKGEVADMVEITKMVNTILEAVNAHKAKYYR